VAVSLRSFRAEDAEAVLALSRRAQTREEEQVGTPLSWTREELDAELSGLDRAPEETLRIAIDEGAVAGVGGIELDDEALLFGPLVSPVFRGRKVGRTLLAASLELARAKEVERLVASIGARNIGGRLMLERNGFEPRGGPVALYRLIPGLHHPVERPIHAGVTTRRAGPADRHAVLDLCHECLARSALSDEAWTRSVDRGQVLVSEEDGAPIAVVRINPSSRKVFHGVTNAARARGLGGFILSQSLEDYWRAHPGEELRLTVPVENVPAARIYRHQGFAPWLLLQQFELAL
jgi:ribosomal protein S18 acetylase RimI-like enzyme